MNRKHTLKVLPVYRFFILLAFCALIFTPAFAQSGADTVEDFFPGLGNGGYDVQHYDLMLNVDVSQNLIDGLVIIEALATQDLSEFNLDFVGFDIQQLTVNDEIADYSRDGRELIITPQQSLTESEAFTVSVQYSGEPDPDTSRGPAYARGWVNYGGRGVFVASEPAGSAFWYPVNDHPSDKATYSMSVTVPYPFVVAANGLLIDVTKEGDLVTYYWESDDEIASYLVAVNIAEFVRREDMSESGVLIRNYFPGDKVEAGIEVFAPTAEMIDLFTEQFGIYPFDAYGVAVANTVLFFALETQTLSLFGAEILGDGWNTPTITPEEVIAHELAHQWFGNSVTPDTWQDIWLNEGFATYAQYLWVEHAEGELASGNRLRQWYANQSNPRLAEANLAQPGNPPAEDFLNRTVYERGALTLHALRLEVGDDAFFEILRTYAERYYHDNAITEDFIAIAEEISGQDLQDLFDAWLFQDELPDIPEMNLTPEDFR